MVFLRDQYRGPILFNIYIATLFEIIDFIPQISFHSYADDIQIYDYMIYVPDSNPNNDAHDCECFSKISNWKSVLFLIEKR